MNKTLKKLLAFILSLIIFVIFIFLAQILLPQKHTNGNSAVTPTVSAKPSPSPAATSSSPSSTAPSPSLSPSPKDEGSVTAEETSDGTKYSITVPGSYLLYSVVADKNVFTHSREDGIDVFISTKDESEYLRVSYIYGAKASDIAPGFLNALIDYKDFEQSGENFINGTKISGETVTANDGNREMTAWLVDTDKGVLAVAVSVHMPDKASQMKQLDKVLAALTIKE